MKEVSPNNRDELEPNDSKADTPSENTGVNLPENQGGRLKSVLCWIWYLPASVAIFLVRIYQWTLSPIIGRQCRFHPSCSNYYILAVRKYGFLSGSCRGFWRICRCNPFCRSGEDFP